ncbi:ubiquitin-conjugating enzyme [Xylaria bambusicola]|uniref:ubiquitin-conjugating enzyme n=1 Tax=Xylaria bambusicola TaxID=326684 RepID=UPI002007DBB0|nr:ubiquitin-conjugating enzyme [Xylaria bambusicola]KAI0509318.1 ubiquitin-conjugating enzyme [Xylaria bambusicola]
MAASQKRITKELQECTESPPQGMTISLPSEADLSKWDVVLAGPPDTPYAGGVYNITVTLPADYPFKAPQVNFATRIYHPNVTNDSMGNICLGVLKPENWKPASRVRAVLEAVRQLLVEPNPEDPLETRIADEYKNNRPEFDKNVKSYVTRYAKPAGK